MVPTARPRQSVTETDEVARARDLAAQRRPAEGENRGRLLLHAVREWADMVSHSRTSHQESIVATSGIATRRRIRTGLPAGAPRGLAGVTVVLDAGVLVAHFDL
jgi:hypothetical protein